MQVLFPAPFLTTHELATQLRCFGPEHGSPISLKQSFWPAPCTIVHVEFTHAACVGVQSIPTKEQSLYAGAPNSPRFDVATEHVLFMHLLIASGNMLVAHPLP